MIFGSPSRTRTYNLSANSRMAFSRLALQTQDLYARKSNSSGNWGDFGGTLKGIMLKSRGLTRDGDWMCSKCAARNVISPIVVCGPCARSLVTAYSETIQMEMGGAKVPPGACDECTW